MARDLPAPSKNAGTVRYRCRTLRGQVDELEQSLLKFVVDSGDAGVRRWLRIIREQLDQIEADMPKQAADKAQWRAENPLVPPGLDDRFAVP